MSTRLPFLSNRAVSAVHLGDDSVQFMQSGEEVQLGEGVTVSAKSELQVPFG